MAEFLKDLWKYFKNRKKYWLLPIVIILLVLGIFIILGGNAVVAPFIYSLF